jgi:mannose-6-phosphate isomerase-like protein (cupin superfamily)
MTGWVGDIERETIENATFRTVLWTGDHSQLTVMSISPGEDIGKEVHTDHDQFLRIEQGSARVELGPSENEVEVKQDVGADWAIVVPAGVWHNLINTGDDDLRVYSIYSPAEHPPGTVHATKAEAEAAEHD